MNRSIPARSISENETRTLANKILAYMNSRPMNRNQFVEFAEIGQGTFARIMHYIPIDRYTANRIRKAMKEQ